MTPGVVLDLSARPHGDRLSRTAVDIQNVRVEYERATAPALDGVSLRVPAGGRVALLGANGAGKSTLLKAIVGLAPVQSGLISILGGSFAVRRRQVAYLAQQSELDWRFPITVHRFVVTGRYVHLGWLRRPSKQDGELATAALERLGIASLAQRQIGQLSGGQRQRILLARALVQNAEIVLLDEPLTAVDAETRSVLTDVLDELHERGTTQIISTHDVESMHLDEVVYLRAGRVLPPEANEHVHALHQMAQWTG